MILVTPFVIWRTRRKVSTWSVISTVSQIQKKMRFPTCRFLKCEKRVKQKTITSDRIRMQYWVLMWMRDFAICRHSTMRNTWPKCYLSKVFHPHMSDVTFGEGTWVLCISLFNTHLLEINSLIHGGTPTFTCWNRFRTKILVLVVAAVVISVIAVVAYNGVKSADEGNGGTTPPPSLYVPPDGHMDAHWQYRCATGCSRWLAFAYNLM